MKPSYDIITKKRLEQNPFSFTKKPTLGAIIRFLERSENNRTIAVALSMNYNRLSKGLLNNLTRVLLMFVLALSCTKDVGLFTEVEFDLARQHTSEGFLNQSLATVLTVIPEAVLEDTAYSFSYRVNGGNGRFEDSTGTILENGTNIPINGLVATLNYIGLNKGLHTVRINVTDNLGFSKQLEIDYLISDIPLAWTLTSPISQIILGEATVLESTLETDAAATDASYEARYDILGGDGNLVFQTDAIALGEFSFIGPGSRNLEFTPSTLGTITVVADVRDSNGQELNAQLVFEVVETIPATAIALCSEETIAMQVGEVRSCPVTFTPINTTDQEVIWSSDNTAAVTVDDQGNLTAISAGPATITVTATGDPSLSDTVMVNVLPETGIPVTSITVSLEPNPSNGGTRQLIAAVLPVDAGNVSVIWSSDNPSVAPVDANGLVTVLSGGTVTITATSVSDPDISDSIVLFLPAPGTNENDILTFALPGQTSVSINDTEPTISVNVPAGTPLLVAPTALTVSPGATFTPALNVVRDFSVPVVYTVTSADNLTQDWTVITNIAVNQPPLTANAGPDITIALPINNITLDGNGSTGTIFSYAWNQESGPGAATITDARAAATTVTGLVAGTYVFSLTVADDGTPPLNDSDTITVTVNEAVIANEDPTAGNDSYTLNQNTALIATVLDNDTDPENNPLTIIAVTQPLNGTVTISPNQTTLGYNPPDGFTGIVNFTYTIDDGNGGNDTATVTVTVNAVANDPLNAVDDNLGNFNLQGSPSFDLNVLGNDTGMGIAIQSVENLPTSQGTLTIQLTGSSIIFTPNPFLNSEIISFNYSIVDSNGNTDSATVTFSTSFICPSGNMPCFGPNGLECPTPGNTNVLICP